MDDMWLKILIPALTVVLTLPFALAQRFVHHITYRHKRMEMLCALTKEKYWRIAHSLELGVAYDLAFGRRCSDDEIRFCLERQNCLELLNNRRLAGSGVEFTGCGFKEIRRWKGFGPQRRGQLWFVFGTCVYAITSGAFILFLHWGEYFRSGVIYLFGFSTFVFCAVIARHHFAVWRVLHLENHPLAVNGPTVPVPSAGQFPDAYENTN